MVTLANQPSYRTNTLLLLLLLLLLRLMIHRSGLVLDMLRQWHGGRVATSSCVGTACGRIWAAVGYETTRLWVTAVCRDDLNVGARVPNLQVGPWGRAGGAGQ
jgi:hypothetical protein